MIEAQKLLQSSERGFSLAAKCCHENLLVQKPTAILIFHNRQAKTT